MQNINNQSRVDGPAVKDLTFTTRNGETQSFTGYITGGGVPSQKSFGIVYELVRGPATIELTGKAMKQDDFIQIISDIVRELHFLHEAEYVHRDIKLDNMKTDIDSKNRITKLVDWDWVEPALEIDTVKGTIAYVSPELIRADTTPIDGRPTDMFAVGVIMYLLHISAPIGEGYGVFGTLGGWGATSKTEETKKKEIETRVNEPRDGKGELNVTLVGDNLVSEGMVIDPTKLKIEDIIDNLLLEDPDTRMTAGQVFQALNGGETLPSGVMADAPLPTGGASGDDAADAKAAEEARRAVEEVQVELARVEAVQAARDRRARLGLPNTATDAECDKGEALTKRALALGLHHSATVWDCDRKEKSLRDEKDLLGKHGPICDNCDTDTELVPEDAPLILQQSQVGTKRWICQYCFENR